MSIKENSKSIGFNSKRAHAYINIVEHPEKANSSTLTTQAV